MCLPQMIDRENFVLFTLLTVIGYSSMEHLLLIYRETIKRMFFLQFFENSSEIQDGWKVKSKRRRPYGIAKDVFIWTKPYVTLRILFGLLVVKQKTKGGIIRGR